VSGRKQKKAVERRQSCQGKHKKGLPKKKALKNRGKSTGIVLRLQIYPKNLKRP